MHPTTLAAIQLAKRGLRVFRLAHGEKDVFVDKDWTNSATCDLFEVMERFGSGAYNIGILADKFVGFDVDAHAGGLESEKELGELPRTLTVRTPRGGVHRIYQPPEGATYANSASKIGPGLDIRAGNGYLVGPGSWTRERRKADGRLDQGEGVYEIIDDAPIAPLPPVLAARLNAATLKSEGGAKVAGALDTPEALAAAVRYLTGPAAHPAIEGEGGDARTFETACRVLDFGISEAAALDLIAEHYNPRCAPPWDLEELETKIANAARYKQSDIGRDNPSAGFTPVTLPPEAPRENAFAAHVRRFEMTEETCAAIPVRPWLASQRLVRGKLSGLVAPGSIGKSLLTLQWACELALGPKHPRSGFSGLKVQERANVLVINNEDEHEELDRRLAAVIQHFGLPWEDIKGRVHLYSGQDSPTFLVAVREGKHALTETEAVNDAIAYMKTHDIGAFVADPIIDTHEADENSNSEMAKVMRSFKRMAHDAHAAGLLVQHSRKTQGQSSDGHAGNMDAGRGAGAVVNAVRFSFTFFNMSAKDAEALGVRPEIKHRYVRLDDAKINYGLASPDAEWFHRTTVKLPNGESMGALEPVTLSPVSSRDPETIAAVLAPLVARDGSLRLKTAAQLLCCDMCFDGETASSMARRISAALPSACEMPTPQGLLIFTPEGKAGGVFELK